tara:strand:+ start:1411 stop:1575 length:165 start_codon:yes stop_codon:yes gene_type:complete
VEPYFAQKKAEWVNSAFDILVSEEIKTKMAGVKGLDLPSFKTFNINNIGIITGT